MISDRKAQRRLHAKLRFRRLFIIDYKLNRDARRPAKVRLRLKAGAGQIAGGGHAVGLLSGDDVGEYGAQIFDPSGVSSIRRCSQAVR